MTWLSGVLAERFKVSLPRVISQQKSASIKKRKILDGILIANELIDSILKSKVPGLLCKIDFEKAFDHVNWKFLDNALEKMSYGSKRGRWVQCCVEHVRFSVLINGSSEGYFKSNKGIGQGDPLSPFLFLILGEAFSAMMCKAQEDGYLNGFRVSANGTMPLTGLRINFSKSHMYGVVYDGDMSAFPFLLGCYNSTLPKSYLGLPLCDKYKGIHKRYKIVDTFTVKLTGWKRPLLTRDGKIILIKSALSILPVYYMYLFEMPKSVVLKLETTMKNFLWNDINGKRKMHLVKYANENYDALWRKIFHEKYGANDVLWLSNFPKGNFGTSVWKGIIQSKELFIKNIRFKVNNGAKTRFLEDVWILNEPLNILFPNLYVIVRSKSTSVAKKFCGLDTEIIDKMRVPGRLFTVARGELEFISNCIADFTIQSQQEYVLQWRLGLQKNQESAELPFPVAMATILPPDPGIELSGASFPLLPGQSSVVPPSLSSANPKRVESPNLSWNGVASRSRSVLPSSSEDLAYVSR
ncbi:uncharacterized protein LOC113291268 [Papaver somniferum]|uniref:uncharacterized protein LOC113291268 n=1 Tax=Papaver somniferum TaxID=3469 RepID=UPI000E704817|nr:uncharacterized protein LOC113291268 [Papaver somniferum]